MNTSPKGGRDAEMTFSPGRKVICSDIHNDDGDNTLTDWDAETGLNGANARANSGTTTGVCKLIPL